MKNIFRTIFSKISIPLFFSLALCGCNGDRCIDADDFGFLKFTISSRYDETLMDSVKNDGSQVMPWVNSNYTVNAQPLVVVVKYWDYKSYGNNSGEMSAWCPWYGGSGNSGTLPMICYRLISCQFVDGQMCVDGSDALIGNAPCLLKNGIGLYALIPDPGFDPNSSISSQRKPKGITLHLGEYSRNFDLFDVTPDGLVVTAGGIFYKYDTLGGDISAVKTKYNNAPLYFKILDKYYNDNAGQYKLVIKSGVTDMRGDPMAMLTDLVKSFFNGDGQGSDGIVKKIYSQIISNGSYQNWVSVLLTLYVIFFGLSFLIGNVKITVAELIFRVTKISIVAALLKTETAWSFFNDYLFVFFTQGLDEALKMVQDAGGGGPGSSDLLGFLLAKETLSKVLALLFADPMGWVFIILYVILLAFVSIVLFEASVIYLTAVVLIGLIIILAPIFICFLLFEFTRPLFENWLKYLISYFVQPIILFTGIAFIGMLIRTEIYSSLGFRACLKPLIDMGGIFGAAGDQSALNVLAQGINTIENPDDPTAGESPGDAEYNTSLFHWWFPVKPKKPDDPVEALKDMTRGFPNSSLEYDSGLGLFSAIIPAPNPHVRSDGTICGAYECLERRYPAFPFFDPGKEQDMDRLADMANGNYVSAWSMLILFVSVYLMYHFNSLTLTIAQYITGTSGSQTSLKSVADSVKEDVKSAASMAVQAVRGDKPPEGKEERNKPKDEKDNPDEGKKNIKDGDEGAEDIVSKK